jgi:beta-phosphoglucomutase-like phosphatase (HAD superfamily)
VIIFDCNGVLVDSERIAAAVAADEFMRVGIPITPELVTRYLGNSHLASVFPGYTQPKFRGLIAG